ncbi:MAG: hypothetical protein EZS28_006403 [Streblomastix strix]|uniref:Uncharacterized protein n=1 Tax=Streblomastix strix TaxID=222440 RepID=A0A5J4WUH4_9EUKA|nr:MAG: hypothetical protein EZS28_006403 [Streblomastix strix]
MWSNPLSFEEWRKIRKTARQQKWARSSEDINGDKFPEFVVRDDRGFILSADGLIITVPIKCQTVTKYFIENITKEDRATTHYKAQKEEDKPADGHRHYFKKYLSPFLKERSFTIAQKTLPMVILHSLLKVELYGLTHASDANPLVDSGTGVVETSTEYSLGDHQHPLQVSAVLPSKHTSVGTISSANTYARSDHQHPIQTEDTIPVSDSADGSYGTVESYARNDHSHPINVQTNASIVPVVYGVGNNDTSAYYSRHDYIHPQQLTFDGNVTATKFIKTGGTSNSKLVYIYILNAGTPTQFASVTSDNIQINSTTTGYDDGLRISRADLTSTSNSSIQLGCSRTPNIGAIKGLWSIFTPPSSSTNNPQSFVITVASQGGDNTRGLQISADRNTFTFNG